MAGGTDAAMFHGLQLPLRRFGGAQALRVVHPARQQIGAHRHDWPYLLLPTLGSYSEIYEGRRTLIDGPAALLHPAGAEHANEVGEAGLETISILFDPAWLGPDARVESRRCWIGGPVGLAARRLAAAWGAGAAPESVLAARTARFLAAALRQQPARKPAWLAELMRALDEGERPNTQALGRRLGLHPAWLARAYRAAMGEGLHEMIRRRRVARASALLRGSELPLAEIALEAGFCDQSHMNRAFRALSGRTPAAVRGERELLPKPAGAGPAHSICLRPTRR